MTLAEIRTMRQTCRAKVEDLLGRTSSREMSTEETQMFTDLKAEGERLGSLESRYAVLESFDKGGQRAVIHRPIAPTETDRKAAIVKALDGFLRTGMMATDTPLQIQQSPVSGAAAAVPTDVIPTIIQGIDDFDIPGRLGVLDFPRDTTNPLVVTMQTAAPAAAVFVEGHGSRRSSTPPTYATVTLAGARYQNLTKYSIESRMNLGVPIVSQRSEGACTRSDSESERGLHGRIQSRYAGQRRCVGGQLGQTHRLMPIRFMSRLKYAQGVFLAELPNNRYLLSPSDLQKVKNARDTTDVRCSMTHQTRFLGKPYVVHPDADRVYYGDFSVSRLPFPHSAVHSDLA